MGWTVHHGLNAQESIAAEMAGTEIIKRQGDWICFRNRHGHVGLVYFLTQRHGHEVAVKDVDITMGPGVVPPRVVAKVYVDLYDGDVEKAGGTYGADLLREALAPKKPTANIKPGDSFWFDTEQSWSDGRAMRGEYVYKGKYRAERYDGATVRLPRNWRNRALLDTPALVTA